MLAVAEKFPIEWYAQRDMHCMVSSACIACIARIAFIACIGCTQSCMHACEACMHVYIACRHTVDGGNVASMTLLVCGRLQEKIIMLRLLGPPPPLLYNIDVRTSRCNIFSFRPCRLLVVSRRQYYRGGVGGDTNSLKSNSFRLNKIDATFLPSTVANAKNLGMHVCECAGTMVRVYVGMQACKHVGMWPRSRRIGM